MDARLQDLVDADWATRLGVGREVLSAGGVHVLAGDVGANDAMSFLVGQTCVVLVRPEEVHRARELVAGVDVGRAFTAEILRALLGPGARVDGPSIHTYVGQRGFTGTSDAAAARIDGDDPTLLELLKSCGRAEWAESGFPERPGTDDGSNRYWVLREAGRIVAAGNMTEWRGCPSDVGILTSPSERRQGFARRLAGAMVHAALPTAGVVRYRALESNLVSLAVASRLGFERCAANFRARRPPP